MNAMGENCVGLVLAAGKGTRMHSETPKVLHTLLGEPMLAYVIAALEPLFGQNLLIVAGHKAESVVAAFPGAQFVRQESQQGTGHALMCAMEEICRRKAEYVAIANGDTPLLTTAVMRDFLEAARGADIAFTTLVPDDPAAYGRVVRRQGKVAAIVEAKDFDPQTHGAHSGEVNGGIYLIRVEVARRLLPLLDNKNRSGEYYITDLVGLAADGGMDVRGIECGRDTALMGINSPRELCFMEERLRARVVEEMLDRGVILHAPDLIRVCPFATIEPGAEISGPAEITGQSVVRSGAVVESHCVVRDSLICQKARVLSFSHLDHASVGIGAKAGPYARLRPGAILEEKAQVGNFVELKKARLGEGAKANHLTYLGDAEIGAHVNIGAGTITCNFDGKNKFRTEIGRNAFIGSNSALVAPVRIGSDSLVGAGSVITGDVDDDSLAIARARQHNLRRNHNK